MRRSHRPDPRSSVIGLARARRRPVVPDRPARCPTSADPRPSASGDVVETKLGLDLQGGFRGEYQALPKTRRPAAPGRGDLADIRDIIENRVNATGVAEPIVRPRAATASSSRCRASRTSRTIRRLVGQTGRLDFVPLPSRRTGPSRPGPQQAVQGQPLPTRGAAAVQRRPVASATIGSDQTGAPGGRLHAQVRGRPPLRATTRPTTSTSSSRSCSTASSSRRRSSRARSPAAGPDRRRHRRLHAGRGEPASSRSCKFGSLPFPIEELSNEQVSATLGASSCSQSLLAGAIGIALVIAVHARPLPAAGRGRRHRADLLRARRASRSSGSSR